jgi:hypothetical protein
MHNAASLRERLHGLAAFLAAFESPGFEFSRWVESPEAESGTKVVAHPELGETAASFVQACYQLGWVGTFDWPRWMMSPEAIQLRDEPGAIENASPEQLARLLTVLIRQERYCDGALQSFFESGWSSQLSVDTLQRRF